MKNILLIALCVLPLFLTAQTSKWSVRADYYKPKPLAPFKIPGDENSYLTSPNYGFAAGVERNWKQNDRFRFYQTAMVGYYSDAYFERVFTIESNAGVDFKLWKGLHTGLELGVGGHRAKASAIRYKYENDKWVPTTENNIVTKRLAINLNAQLGYRISPKLDIYAGFGGHVITPLIKLTDFSIPFFAYTQPRFGVRWRL
jgi:opacity protein-like surface antigen